jgi:S1-C subfamily serine protease
MKRNCLIILVFIIFTTSLFSQNQVFLGINLKDYYSNQNSDFKGRYGVLVSTVVPDSPAELAGLQSMDLLLELDSEKLYTKDQLIRMLQNYSPGQKVKLKYYREGKEITTRITLAEKKNPALKKKAYLGVFLREMKENDRLKLNYQKNYGIIITDLVADGPAMKSGIKPNSVLMELDGNKIYTTEQLIKMLKDYEPGNKIELIVFQDNSTLKLDLILADKLEYSSSFYSEKDFGFAKPGKVFVYHYPEGRDKWIGIKMQINKTNVSDDISVKVIDVIEGTPAAAAGIKIGDLITKADDIVLNDSELLSSIINKKEVGEEIKLHIQRNGVEKIMICPIAKRPDSISDSRFQISFDDGEITILIDDEEKKLFDMKQLENIWRFKDIITDEQIQEIMEKAKEELKNLTDHEEIQKLKELEIKIDKNGAI